MSTAHRYVHADTPYGPELERLRLLEARYDGQTVRRLRALGPMAGWRCLEVGAGAGSVARFLAGEVGASGHVVATDADPRFLRDAPAPNVTVRQHDVVTDELEESAFDLVHCRALLLHLSDPLRALERMAAALRPGGWLVVEDADYSSFVAIDPDHPAAAVFDRVVHRILTASRDVLPFDPYFGRRLPGLMDVLGLADRGDEAIAFPRVGGGVEARFFARSFAVRRAETVAMGGVYPHEFDLVLEAFADPSFAFVDSLSVAAWGRRRAGDLGFMG